MSVPTLIHRTSSPTHGSPPYPALVLLHGLGSDERDLLSIAPYLDGRLLTISVRAPLPYRWGGYMWYDLEQEGPGLAGPGVTRSLEMLDALLTTIGDTLPVEPTAIYLGGFSQGAAMAGAYSLLHRQRISGTIMASGFLPPDPSHQYAQSEVSGLPIFQAHGTNDGVVPLAAAHLTRDYLQTLPVQLTYREYPIRARGQ